MLESRLKFDPATCTIAAALGIVGEKWTLLVMREAFFGLRRYDEFLEILGCARNVLSDRLQTLVGHGLLDRVPYQDKGQRERHEYRLTAKGSELYVVLMALRQWGDRHLAPAGPPLISQHAQCGHPVHVELRCSAGHGPLTARDTEPTQGPGARVTRRRPPSHPNG